MGISEVKAGEREAVLRIRESVGALNQAIGLLAEIAAREYDPKTGDDPIESSESVRRVRGLLNRLGEAASQENKLMASMKAERLIADCDSLLNELDKLLGGAGQPRKVN